MKRMLATLYLPLLLLFVCRPALAVFPDRIPTPEISMAEAVKAATAALEPYFKKHPVGLHADFQPIQANYIWRAQQLNAYSQRLTNGETGIWEVMFAPTPDAHAKVYVYIRREGREAVIYTMYH